MMIDLDEENLDFLRKLLKEFHPTHPLNGVLVARLIAKISKNEEGEPVLICPNCDHEEFHVVEWEIYSRDVKKFDDEMLIIYGVGESDYESGVDMRLECRHCFNQCEIPPGLELDYV
jgi:hypothetical protein